MTARRHHEQTLQKALADHLRARGGWHLLVSPCQRRCSDCDRGRDPQACGVRAGTPDMILIKDGKTFGLELKADNGQVSPAQAQAHQEMRAAGAEVAVATGIDEAIKQLEAWQLLRGQTQ